MVKEEKSSSKNSQHSKIYEKRTLAQTQIRDIIFVKTWSSIRSSFMLHMKPDQLKNDDDKGFLNLLFEKRIEVDRRPQQLTGFSLIYLKKVQDYSNRNY
jgi:hypothetical protein